MTRKETVTGWNYMSLALLSFATLGLELLLAFVEPFFYGRPVSFQNWTIFLHWGITLVLWGAAIVCIVRFAQTRYGFRMKEGASKIRLWQWAAVLALVLFAGLVAYWDWGGFKPLKEFFHLGIAAFILQYVYYLFETALFTLILVFGQKACEAWFHRKNIPYGGILCGLTWGIAHIFTKSNAAIGLLTAVLGFGFGAVYLLLNRDMRKTVPILFLMFVL